MFDRIRAGAIADIRRGHWDQLENQP
jgi:hypothetical protein